MVTTGVLGRTWRAEVTPWGAVVPWDGSPTLDWAIAADDRWHRPSEERAVRQEAVQGTPVLETRVRIPGGDAVQRVWSVADQGGLTLVEVHNESPLPIAVALTRPDVLTTRAPTDVPIEGIELPAGSVLLPVGHRTRVVAGLAHAGGGPGGLPTGWADAITVARGWRTSVERAGHLVLPDERPADLVVAARAQLLLDGLDDPQHDPTAFLIGLGELQRLRELTPRQVGDLAVEIATAVEAVGRDRGWDVDAALDAAARVFRHGGDDRAGRDVDDVIERRGRADLPDSDASPPTGVRVIPFVERPLAARGLLLPGGLPATWRGSSVEAHGLAIGPATEISFALRWHGPNLAVLWEAAGSPITLAAPAVAPSWSSDERSGEALWQDPTVGSEASPHPNLA